jgi:hypothetical protein
MVAQGQLSEQAEAAAARGHRLTVSLPAEPLHLVADPLRLEQVLTNLVVNATKFTDPGGDIRLSIMFVPEFLRASLDRVFALANGFGDLEHEGVKGVLRESLIESFLEPLLMPPYRAGTGVIIDCKGRQSGQCDIIIWDDSIFRPLYSARGAGIYFIESVVAVLEVKSTLTRDSFRQAIQRSREFKDMFILRPGDDASPNTAWGPEPEILPMSLLFGFRSDIQGSEGERAEAVAAEQGIDLCQFLQMVVVPGKDAWVFDSPPIHIKVEPQNRHHEVLMAFSAVLHFPMKASIVT